MNKFQQVGMVDRHWAIESDVANSYRRLLEGISVVEASRRQAEWETEQKAKNPLAEIKGLMPDRVSTAEDKPYVLTMEGVAVLRIKGVMTKEMTSAAWLVGGTSTVAVRRQLRAAIADPDVKRVLMIFDTPGGSVSGVDELARDILRLKAEKPIDGFCDDLCASAGYWPASACRTLSANPAALIGNVGVYNSLVDSSAAYEEAGLKVVVSKFGEYKAIGEDGTEVTDEQKAEIERMVTALGNRFVDAIAEGRGIDRKKALKFADGRIHIASEALALGLIDKICSFDEALLLSDEDEENSDVDDTDDQPAALNGANPTGGKNTMAEEKKSLFAQFKELFAKNGIDIEAAGGGEPSSAAENDQLKAQVADLQKQVAALGTASTQQAASVKEKAEAAANAHLEALMAKCCGGLDADEKEQAQVLAAAAIAADDGEPGDVCAAFEALMAPVKAGADMKKPKLATAHANTTAKQEKAAAGVSKRAGGSVQTYYGGN